MFYKNIPKKMRKFIMFGCITHIQDMKLLVTILILQIKFLTQGGSNLMLSSHS